MAKTRNMIGDTGSTVVYDLVAQINRLTRAVEALKAGAVTDAPTIITNTAAVVTSDFETLVFEHAVPAPRQIKLK